MLDSVKKINYLITKQQRKALVLLTILLFIGVVLEVFGLGMIIPLISIMLDKSSVSKLTDMFPTLDFLLSFSHNELISYALISLFSIYLLKSFFLVLLNYKQNNFLSKLGAHISNTLFELYISQNYSYHLKANSSRLIKNIQQEVAIFNSFNQALMNLFIESALVLSVLITLVIIEPIGALAVGGLLLLLSILFFQFTKRRLSNWGQVRQVLDTQISKVILEGFGSIKTLKVLGREAVFITKLSKLNIDKALITAKSNTINLLPRYYLELMSIFGLSIFIVSKILLGSDLTSLVAVLGVFVAAIFRAMPSANKIIASLQTLKYQKASIDVLYTEFSTLNLVKPYSNKSAKPFYNLSMHDLSYTYEGSNKFVLKNINLTINKGDAVGIIGTSGAGKSTLIDIIIGLLGVDKENYKINDGALTPTSQNWKMKIGYVPQDIFLLDASIKENIAFGIAADKINEEQVKYALNASQLFNFTQGLEKGIETTVGERGVQLSGGQKQRIGIARALYNNPELIVLDEATAALDTKTESEVMDAIKSLKREKTIIIIAHRLSTLKECDYIYEISNGEIKKTDI
jgi:ABC-type multidrug transport system fused ATPase/permease subunit